MTTFEVDCKDTKAESEHSTPELAIRELKTEPSEHGETDVQTDPQTDSDVHKTPSTEAEEMQTSSNAENPELPGINELPIDPLLLNEGPVPSPDVNQHMGNEQDCFMAPAFMNNGPFNGPQPVNFLPPYQPQSMGYVPTNLNSFSIPPEMIDARQWPPQYPHPPTGPFNGPAAFYNDPYARALNNQFFPRMPVPPHPGLLVWGQSPPVQQPFMPFGRMNSPSNESDYTDDEVMTPIFDRRKIARLIRGAPKNSIKSYARVDSGQFVCLYKECLGTFRSSQIVERHIASIHLNDMYWCPNPLCSTNQTKSKKRNGPGFNRLSSLVRHIEGENGSKRRANNPCWMAFSSLGRDSLCVKEMPVHLRVDEQDEEKEAVTESS